MEWCWPQTLWFSCVPWSHSGLNTLLQTAHWKVRTRNNLLHKLANSSWGANTFTLRATALALCYSVAEYACPVWERSSHAKKVDASLNDSCRCITGCLRPTNVDNLYVLAGIAPPGVRRSVASRTERRRQADDTRHPCHNHQPAPSRLKSRKSFLHAVQPLSQPPQTARLYSIVGGTTNCKATRAAAKPIWVNGAMLMQQIHPVNAGPQSRPCSTCWDAHFLKMNAAWKIWQLLMRRLSTVQEPGQTYNSVQGWWTRKKNLSKW